MKTSKSSKRLLSFILMAALVFALLPAAALPASAAATEVANWNELVAAYDGDGDKTITIPSGTTVLVTGVLEVPEDGEYTLTGGGTLKLDSSFGDDDMLLVSTGAKLTLDNLTLDGAGISGIYDLVYICGGEFTMTGGKITNGAGNYGGVYVGGTYDDYSLINPGTFTMTGGSVTGNTGSYGSVYIEEGSAFLVSGGATVTGNKSGGTACNVYLDGSAITITGALTGTIGITVDSTYTPTTVAIPGEAYTIKQTDLARLSSDGGYALQLNTSSVVEMTNPISISYASWTLEGLEPDGDGGYYTTYNGQTQKPSAVKLTFWDAESDEDIELVEGRDYTWAITSADAPYNWDSAGKNAGYVEITVTGKGAYGGTLTAWYYIEPKPLTITGVTMGDCVYGSASYPVVESVTFSGLVNGETLAMYTDYMAQAWFSIQHNVGNVPVNISVSLSSPKACNYMLDNYFPVSTCTVKPAALTGVVSIEVFDQDYGGTINAGDPLYVMESTNYDYSAALAYQWYRNGTLIGTGNSYTLTSADAGASITVTVTASGNYTGSLTSAPVVVGKKSLGTGLWFDGPQTDWTAGVDLTLDIDYDYFDPAATYSIQWYRNGAAIPGATTDTYRLTKADLGKTIAVVVTGTGNYTGTLNTGVPIHPTEPDAPVLTATPGDGQVTLSWATPFDGGSPILGYFLAVSTDTGNIAWYSPAPTATSFVVTGLQNGTKYTFELTLWNYYEHDDVSATVTATPVAGGSGGLIGGGTTQTIPASDGEVTVEYSQSGGEVTLTLPDSKISEIIGKSGTTAVLDLSGVNNAATATLPKTALTAFADAGLDVELRLPGGTVVLSGEAAASVAQQATGSDVSLEVKQAPVSSLNAAQREAVKDGDTVIDINILSGTKKISDFDGELTITIPYTGALPAAVWYLNEAGELEKLECTYNPVTKTISFTLDHLSLYVIGLDTAWANPFTDVKKTDWFYGAVEYAVTRGLFNGTSTTTFAPKTAMTRGMMATVLWRMAGEPLPQDDNPFTDLTQNWYIDAVAWAAENGIVEGYGGGRFGPEDDITREQMAVMLYRYMDYAKVEYVVTDEYRIFADEDAISDYAKNAVQVLNKLGIINGRGNNVIDPQAGATRAEVATMLMNFLEAMK